MRQIRRKRRGRVSKDGGKPCPRAWACWGAQQRTVAGPNGRQQDMLSEKIMRCESSIPLPIYGARHVLPATVLIEGMPPSLVAESSLDRLGARLQTLRLGGLARPDRREAGRNAMSRA